MSTKRTRRWTPTGSGLAKQLHEQRFVAKGCKAVVRKRYDSYGIMLDTTREWVWGVIKNGKQLAGGGSKPRIASEAKAKRAALKSLAKICGK
jgi:hypothetical protein